MSTMPDISTNSSVKRQIDEDDEQSRKRPKQADTEDLDTVKDAVEVIDPVKPLEIGNMTTDSDEDTDDEVEEEEKEEEGVIEMEGQKEEEQNSATAEESSSVENDVDLSALSISELLSQTELNCKRKKAIEAVFVQKYATNHSFLLEIIGRSAQNWNNVLRHFGHLITTLDIDYSQFDDLKDCIEIDRSVNEYCADSLTELKIKQAPRFIMSNIAKPFTKLETLAFENCHLSSNSTDFNRWFPMMRSLTFFGRYNELVERSCIEAHFSHLNGLVIDRNFGKSNVAEALRLNANLRELKIYGFSFDANFLRNVSEHLPHLECLDFKLDGTVPDVQFKNLKSLSIKDLRQSDVLPSIPITCDQLKEFSFTTASVRVNECVGFVRELCAFITKHASLQTFKLQSYFYKIAMGAEQKMQLAKACSTLTKIELTEVSFSASEALDFINQCKCLENFTFRFHKEKSGNESSFDQFANSLSDEWQVSKEWSCVNLTRVIDAENDEKPLAEFKKLIERTEDTPLSSNEPSTESEGDDFADEFSDMKLTNLLQAAESNTRKKVAIETVFFDKFHVETVYFSPSSTPIEYQSGITFIGDTKVCLSFLQFFGHFIKKMQMEFDDDELLCHLNEYCADSLLELNISRSTNESIADVRAFKKPFSRVEVLEFNNSTLNQQLMNIHKWFPQIRSLKFLNQTKLTDCECLMMPFPRLEHLTIDFKALVSYRMDRDRDLFDSDSIAAALRLNPQLRSVAFIHVDTGFVHNVSKHLQFLEDIHIKWNERYSDQCCHEMRFKRSVQELQVNFNFGDTQTQSIPLTFGRLKTLSLEASELNDDLRKFIRKHPTITELSLRFEKEEREIELLQLFKTMPSLMAFNVDGVTCSVEEVIYLLYIYPAMKKLRFRIRDRSKYDGMRLLLAKWETAIDDMNYVQLKCQNNNAE